MRSALRPAIVIVSGLLLPLSACRSADQRPSWLDRKPANTFEVLFVEKDHELTACARGLKENLLDLPDGVLFYEADSKIRIKTPRGKEPYHAHLYHRVGEDLVDRVVRETDSTSEAIELDFSGFPSPEHLVVTSAAHRMERNRLAGPDELDSPAILPPYSLSFKLVPFDQAETLMALQSFRYEARTPRGVMSLFVQPVNRGDMLLTWIDPLHTHGSIFADAYVHFAPLDAVVVPRLTVEVAQADGRVWQRAGAWPVPPGEFPAAKRPPVGADRDAHFAIRTPRQELVKFSGPPRLRLNLVGDRPETSIQVKAVVSHADEDETFTAVLAPTVPLAGGAVSDYPPQTLQLSSSEPEAVASVDLGSLDPARYPLTASITHRFVFPWIAKGGAFLPQPPRGITVIRESQDSSKEARPKLHARVITAASAAYYDLVRFWGPAGAKSGAGLSKSISRISAGDDGAPSPNIIPDPTGGGGIGGGGIAGGGAAGASPAAPSGSPAGSGFGVFGGNIAGGGGFQAQGSGAPGLPGWGGGGPNPPPGGGGGQSPGDLKIDLGCGCGMAICRCPPHSWSMHDIMGKVMEYKNVQDSNGNRYAIADYAWSGPHGGTAPCHEWTLVGQVRFSFWVGWQLMSITYNVYVGFFPCEERKPPPKDPPGKPKDPPGQPKDSGDPRNPPGPPTPTESNSSKTGKLTLVTTIDGSADTPFTTHPFNEPAFADYIASYGIKIPGVVAANGSTLAAWTAALTLPLQELAQSLREMPAFYWARSGQSSPANGIPLVPDSLHKDSGVVDPRILGSGGVPPPALPPPPPPLPPPPPPSTEPPPPK